MLDDVGLAHCLNGHGVVAHAVVGNPNWGTHIESMMGRILVLQVYAVDDRSTLLRGAKSISINSNNYDFKSPI